MKKLAIGLFALVFLGVVGLLIAPLFLSPNDFKQIIQTKFHDKTGFELALTGDIEVSLFPVPKASVDEISVSNNSRILATAKNITAYPKLGDLLAGNFVVDGLDINEPNLVIEKNRGQFSWQQTSYAADKDAEKIVGAAQSATNLSINSITINKGSFEYRDKDKNKNYVAKDLSVNASLASLNGPLTFSANTIFMDEKASLKGDINNLSAPEINLAASFMGSNLSLNGGMQKAKLAIESKDIAPIAQKLELNEVAYMAGKPISLSANVSLPDNSIQLEDITVQLAQTKGVGKAVIIPFEESVDISAELKFQNIDLADIIPPKNQDIAEEKVESADEFRESINQTKLVANLILSADEVRYGKSVFDDVNLQAAYDSGNIILGSLSTSLAKTGKAEISGILNQDSKGRAFDGNINASSSDFRKFLNRVGVDTASIKEGSLKGFELNSDFYARIKDDTKLSFSKMEAGLDDSKFSGSLGLVVTNGGKSLDVTGAIGQINLDKYIIEKVEPKQLTLEQKKQKQLESKLDFSWLRDLPLSGKTNLSIGEIIHHGKTYSSNKIQLEFKPSRIDFSNISAASPEIQFSTRGGLMLNNSRPKLFLEANLGAINTLDFIENGSTPDKDSPAPLPENEDRWSRQAFDFSPLDEIDIDFVANSPLINHKGLMLDNVSLKGYLASSKATLEKFNAGVFGGDLALKGQFGIGAVASASINFEMANFDLSAVAKTLADNDRIQQGRMTVKGGFRSSGVHQRAMAENLEGTISIGGSDIWVKGFDLDSFANQITNINGPEALIPVAKTLTGDSNLTRINTISGGFLCGQGIFKPQNLKLATNSAAGTYEGYIDIVKWYMDTTALFKVVLADSKERPGFGIRMFGSISEPKQEKDFDELIAYYSKRLARGILNIPQKEEITDPKKQLKNELLQKGVEGIFKGVTQ